MQSIYLKSKNAIETFVTWIVISSANPDQTSLTIKGILVGIIPAVIAFLAQVGYNVDSSVFVHWVNVVTSALSALLIVVGMLRKLSIAISTPNAGPTDGTVAQ